MPTDEQLREQFEVIAVSQWMVDEDDLARSTRTPDAYADPLIQSMWNGYRSRDAEVQALREALGRLLIATDQIERYDDTTDLIAAADRALW